MPTLEYSPVQIQQTGSASGISDMSSLSHAESAAVQQALLATIAAQKQELGELSTLRRQLREEQRRWEFTERERAELQAALTAAQEENGRLRAEVAAAQSAAAVARTAAAEAAQGVKAAQADLNATQLTAAAAFGVPESRMQELAATGPGLSTVAAAVRSASFEQVVQAATSDWHAPLSSQWWADPRFMAGAPVYAAVCHSLVHALRRRSRQFAIAGTELEAARDELEELRQVVAQTVTGQHLAAAHAAALQKAMARSRARERSSVPQASEPAAPAQAPPAPASSVSQPSSAHDEQPAASRSSCSRPSRRGRVRHASNSFVTARKSRTSSRRRNSGASRSSSSSSDSSASSASHDRVRRHSTKAKRLQQLEEELAVARIKQRAAESELAARATATRSQAGTWHQPITSSGNEWTPRSSSSPSGAAGMPARAPLYVGGPAPPAAGGAGTAMYYAAPSVFRASGTLGLKHWEAAPVPVPRTEKRGVRKASKGAKRRARSGSSKRARSGSRPGHVRAWR